MTESPLISIVIVTHNRKDELVTALESCYAQTYRPLEVLVYDDASTDGTEHIVRDRFPDVRYCRAETHVGYVVYRSRSFREARGKFVFSIDDDAYFSDPDTVGRTVEMFEAHSQAAAIAMPYCEPYRHKRTAVLSSKPGDRLRTFIGCAHALRVDAVREIGGYRDFLYDQGEERDLSIRLQDRGYDVVYGATPPVMHMVSPKRSLTRMSYYGARNILLFDFLNLPLPYVAARLAIDATRMFFYSLTWRTLPWRVYCVTGGPLACVKHAGHRRAVSRATYKRYRSLSLHLPVPTDVQGRVISTDGNGQHELPSRSSARQTSPSEC